MNLEKRIALLSVLILNTLLLTASPVFCQSPNYILYFEHVSAAPGADLSVNCLLENQGSDLGAWAIGVCYEASAIEIVGAEAGMAPQSVNGGAVADYLNLEIWPGEGVLQEVIVSTTPPFHSLGPGAAHELVRIDLKYVGPVGSTASVEYCSAIPSVNPIETVVETTGGLTISPVLEESVFSVVATFIRGDINGDSNVDLADVIILLGYLFNGAIPPGCIDACDGTDDGLVNLADAITFLGYLFVQGNSQVPSPNQDCGVDPTNDPLDCLNAGGC